jgi:anti-sigma factor RsiW
VTDCAHVREDLGGYLFDALEPAEREAVAAHLATCPECTALHAELAGLPPLVAAADGLEIPRPPAKIEERLLDTVARERPRPKRRRFRLPLNRRVALAAGAVLGAAAAALALTVTHDDSSPGPGGAYDVVMRSAQGASAHAALEPGRGGTQVHLWVRGLPPGGRAVYEVRCERPGWSASAGTFRADARGRAYVVLTTAARLGEYERIRVVRRARQRETNVMTATLN